MKPKSENFNMQSLSPILLILNLTFSTVIGQDYEVFYNTILSFQSSVGNLEEVFFTNINDADFDATTEKLITSKGYPFEIHRALTPEGYFLELHRIPGPKDGKNYEAQVKPVVFLQHGIFTSSSEWVINFPSNSLGFILADAGYDVWMGNFRGNCYSRQNIFLETDNPDFFKFGIDELAMSDLPTMIDYVLEESHVEKLFYIGHDLGNTAMFALLSEQPDFGEKLYLVIALAPMTAIPNFQTSARLLLPLVELFKPFLTYVTDILGTENELLANYKYFDVLAETFCEIGFIREIFCSPTLFFFLGPESSDMFNVSRIPVYLSHAPAGTSVDTFLQYVQSLDGKFKMFDFGEIRNMEVYGKPQPPLYNTNVITTPVALFSSSTDYIAVQKDINFLRNTLPNIILDAIVDRENYIEIFSHIDFVYGVNAQNIVYNSILKLLKQSI